MRQQQNEKPLYCENGVIKICEMLLKKKPQLAYVSQQIRFYDSIKQISDHKIIDQHRENISVFFNSYYLVSKLLDEMLKPSNQLEDNVGDKKIIKVVLKSFLIKQCEQFKLKSTWRPTQMNQCIKIIDQNIKRLVYEQKCEKIFIEDINHLYSAKIIFQLPELQQAYQQLGKRLQEKQYSHCDQKATQKIFIKFLEHYYRVLGNYDHNKIITERIKVMISIMRYKQTAVILDVGLNQKSILKALTKWKGYQIFQKFFNQVSLQEIQEQKQYYKVYRMESQKKIPQKAH